jgi:hypothetical protein
MRKSIIILLVLLYSIYVLPAYSATAIDVGTPTVTPTFECVGIELPFTGDDDRDAHCDIHFRKSGTTSWRNGLRLYTDYHTDRIGFRGSIVHLEPGTEYDIRLTYNDPDGGSGQAEITASTWSESFIQGNLVQVNSQNSTLVVQSGSPGAYRVYDGALNNAIVDVDNAEYCVNIENKSYIILRNIIFRESDRHAVRIKDSHHIIIEDCEILNWGRPGTYCAGQPGAVQDAAVQIESGEQIIVQHNHIHDPRGNTCDWRTAHPKGPRGIYFRRPVRHSVFRYNRIAGNPDHYYQDIITGGSQGPDSDVDIYGNEISNTWDDGIEIEGNNINIRVWNNVVYNSFKGVASDNNDDTYYGPVYIWRNIFTDMFLSPDNVQSGDAFKLENEVGRGGIYLFNNTILGNTNHSLPRRAITNGPIFNLTAYNNIFDVEDIAYKDNVQTGSYLDYNGYSHARDAINAGVQSDWEKNGLFQHRFEYVNPEGWIYYLKPGNTAIDAGIILNNFADKFAGQAPDLGACEEGSWFVHVGPHADTLRRKPTATIQYTNLQKQN